MGFTLPDTLPTDADGLAQLRAKAVDAFTEIYGDGTGAPTPEEFAEMKAITDAIKTIDDAAGEMAAADERTAAAAEMFAGLTPGANDDEEEAEEARAEESEEEGTAPTGDEEEDDGEEEAVTASGRTRFSDAATGKTPPVPAPERGFRLTTSAKDYESGIVDLQRVAEEFNNAAHGRTARMIGVGGRSETTIAYIERDVPDEFAIVDEVDVAGAVDRAVNESRLPGGSLVAAGGWCAPSETSYDFLPTLPVSGLLSLPEVSARRGGIKYPVEPDFAAIYSAIGFHQTEAQAQAGTEKNCYEIPCGEFEELRLDVQGVCITSGILQNKAWPEQTAKFTAEALRLHQHKVNARAVDTIVKGSTAVTGFTGTIGAAGALLATVELQVADMRARHRLGRTQSLEGMAPEWMLSVLRADLAYRDEVLPELVTDEHILQHFRNLGANLQFVADWQNEEIGASTAPKAWPTEVKIALWPAGTWFRIIEPVINLGVVVDSTLLKQNKQIQMFTEEGIAVGKRGVESRLITVPVKVDGMVGLRGPVAAG